MSTPTPPERIRLARRQWLETGSVASGLITGPLQASWARCRDFGLAPEGRPQGAPHASAAQLARALEHRHALMAHAKPVMAFLNEQVQGSDSLVLLADAHGLLLHASGDAPFADRAARVALRPGALWSEQWRGTNAIGTALAEGAPVVVHAGEHYLARNGFLTCAAAPIADPAGQLLGVLDISGDRRGYHRHTLALARSGARMIEHQLFLDRFRAGLHLRLHAQMEGLGTVTEGLLALSEDGWVTGANTVALELLGLARPDIGAATVERVLGLDLRALLAHGAAPHALPRGGSAPLWMRLEPGQTLRRSPATPASPGRPAPALPATDAAWHPQDALAALDTGDAAFSALLARARKLLDKPAIPLLLQGESGTGKELLAKAIHSSSARRDKPFVAVNCAALPETLIEAELFGYCPGAFTGANRHGAPGRIREAHGGTLFLDEIGDMPLAMQARLLRVLQDRQVTPLGGGAAVDVDFRLICATHHRLKDEVAAGRFREDLYYRLNGLTLSLPPLRERSDLGELVARLLKAEAPERALGVCDEVMALFSRYRWPGNVRQLANVVRTAVALLDDEDDTLTLVQVGAELSEAQENAAGVAVPAALPSSGDLRQLADMRIRETLAAFDGNVSRAARQLGVSRNTLYRRLKGGSPGL
ncbi:MULTISPECIES: sigma-54-dependent Fis family transcriptional regulator [unclassified Roseateles]|uniref:sigma-54-dependent Fis family transcriptional regulator n=1 Tax=unclassified Roseateles TaxID=2626991 RepID=UPI0007021D97|nr:MULTISPECIES: sigma-54-dependent Fis family transcriptional regulator [unclassified Roseateles]KQW45695.1 AAA family ATPase [Pelomonas sp. Root405]KRA72539.1 AAA family ATPase [Pelomonas sp. Root662]